MKKFITIGLIQTKVSNNVALNVEKTVKLIKQAAKRGAQIVCLQELFNIPYIPQRQGVKKDKYAEKIPSKTTLIMQKLAKQLGIVVIVPIYEKTSKGEYYNTAVVFNDKGKMLGKYHKVHIPQDPGFYEKDYFEDGSDGYKIFKTKFGTFAVLICYDQWFPEAARAARIAGAEIIFFPTAIADIIGYKHPNDWHDAWETSMRGHAIANSVVVAAPNRVGTEGRSRFWGQSFVCDAWGKVLKRASSSKEEIVIQKVNLEYNKFLSEGWDFLRNRRPDTYKNLISNKFIKKSKKLAKVAHYREEKRALQGRSLGKFS